MVTWKKNFLIDFLRIETEPELKLFYPYSKGRFIRIKVDAIFNCPIIFIDAKTLKIDNQKDEYIVKKMYTIKLLN